MNVRNIAVGALAIATVAIAVGFTTNNVKTASAETVKGQPIKFTNSDGSATVSGYEGKLVVLEWFNEGCPIVVRHYGSKNMQSLQKKYTDKGVSWVTIVSSKPGSQGHVNPEQAVARGKEWNSSWSDFVLDPSGDVGRLFAAKTTPHMIIIDKTGKIVYDGAIDSNRSGRASAAETENYVEKALDAVMAGQPVKTPKTQPYGCGIKY